MAGKNKISVRGTGVQRARDLRQRQTPAEVVMWELLRNRRLMGFKFRRQHPIDAFIVDFYCEEARLFIELDGSYHDSPEQYAKDQERSKHLRSLGLKELRFRNEEVLDDKERTLSTISEALTPAPSPRGRGARGEGEG